MQHVLSYPRYFPGPQDLRAYLLLYDRVSTIVPWHDQPRVLALPEVAKLAEMLDEVPLGFYDPTNYFGDWDGQPELANNFAELLVRRHMDWDILRFELSEYLAHPVMHSMRRLCGDASAGFRLSSV